MIKVSAKDFVAIHNVNYKDNARANVLAIEVLSYALQNVTSACSAPSFAEYCDVIDDTE